MTWPRIAWGVAVLVVAGLFALSQFEKLKSAQILTSIDAFVLLLFTPPIIWDACCRVSPRPKTMIAIIAEWFLRYWLAYFWTFMMTFSAIGFVTGVGPLRWSGGAFQNTMTPEIRMMYPERAFTMAVSIIVAALGIAKYDCWIASRKSTDRTKP
jgi:hypothetical protein